MLCFCAGQDYLLLDIEIYKLFEGVDLFGIEFSVAHHIRSIKGGRKNVNITEVIIKKDLIPKLK